MDLIGIEPMTSSMPSALRSRKSAPVVPLFSIHLSLGRGREEVRGQAFNP